MMTVLGISTSSRVIGLAVMKADDLLEYAIHQHQEKWSELKAMRIIYCINRLIKAYAIDHVALTIPYAHYTSPEAKACLARITRFCRKKKLAFSTYIPSAFHCLCEAQKARKKALMKALAAKYPELQTLYSRELRNKRRYYGKLFEAVAVAMLESSKISR